MNKPVTEEEFTDALGKLKATTRIEIAICALAGRIAMHGTTLAVEEVVDVFKQMLAAHRASSVESFLGDVIMKDVNSDADCDRFHAQGGEVAIAILQSFISMGDLAEKHGELAYNLYEHALKAEKKNV